MTLLRCLKCGEKLDRRPQACVCPKCEVTWPVSNGIPRFFQAPDHYWGEVGRNQALELLEADIERKNGAFEVFAWGDLADGLPPLYDLFQFFYSTGYLPPEEETVRFASEEDRWIATFKAVFLSDSMFGRVTRRLIGRAGELNVSPEQVLADGVPDYSIQLLSAEVCATRQPASLCGLR